MNHLAKHSFLAGSLGLAFTLAGCGGGRDFGSITAELKTPTGTVDATSVKAIGPKLEEQSQANGLPGFGGEREDTRENTQAASATVACPAGGSVTATGDGNSSKGKSSAQYNNCCMQADCCFNGSADVYYDTSSTEFSSCMDYNLSFNCTVTAGESSATSSGAIDFSGCVSISGSTIGLVYLIEIEGLSYRVSGTYGAGNGTLEIAGANGSYSCTYTSGSGSCTGTGTTSGSFTF
jgi:hypothetical protein